MAWSDIIGQGHAKSILQRAIHEKRIAHAYCLWGIEGIGKDAIAIEFAKTVNCHNPVMTENSVEACGACQSCHHAATLQHQNIQLVFALPAPKGSETRDDTPFSKMSDDQINDIQEQISIKAANPYHRIALQNANQIRISSIRDVKKNLVYAANQSGRRVVIISRADEMTNEAANSFLKTLEEPHENITIIITTSRKGSLPVTILSRCQLVHCEPLSDEDLALYLSEKFNMQHEEAKLIAAFARGSYSDALAYMDENMKAFRDDVVSVLRTALKKKIFRVELLKELEKYLKEKDRQKAENFMILLMLWLRDVNTFTVTGSESFIVNNDQSDIIRKFSRNFGNKDLMASIQCLDNAVTQLRRNVMPQLVFINLFIKLREIFF